MLNLIGELPELPPLLALPDLHLHLYGKAEKPGRKLGHLTLRCASPEALKRQWQQLQYLTTKALVNWCPCALKIGEGTTTISCASSKFRRGSRED